MISVVFSGARVRTAFPATFLRFWMLLDVRDRKFAIVISSDFSIDIETTAYEDLDKSKSDRYEFILPKIDLVKKIDNKEEVNNPINEKDLKNL